MVTVFILILALVLIGVGGWIIHPSVGLIGVGGLLWIDMFVGARRQL
jgi:hypothetical protein